MNRPFSLWLPVFIWMGLIYYLSSRPGLAIGEGAVDFWTRKPAHIVEYAVLFLLLFRAMKGSATWRNKTIVISAATASFLYATTDEFHQFLVPLREGRLYDLGFDLLGIVIGAWLTRFRRRK